MIAKGSIAPDFTLKDQDGKAVKLSTLKAKKILLSFKPLAWTPTCTDHVRLLEEEYARFEENKTVPLVIGVDSAASNKAWAKSMGLKRIRLLADFWPHGEVAGLYGVFREKDGFSERANILLDEKRKVIFTKIYPTSEVPDIQEILDLL